jgi:hypothetical protein
MNLRKLTFEFDEFAEEHRDRKHWTESQEPSTTNCVPTLTTRCRRSSAPLASASKKYSAAPSADPHGPAAWWATWPGEATLQAKLPAAAARFFDAIQNKGTSCIGRHFQQVAGRRQMWPKERINCTDRG